MSVGPAARAGITAGDILTQVNGRNLRGQSLDYAADLIAGPAGTSLTVRVLRDGRSSLITLNRARVAVYSVSDVRMLGGNDAEHVAMLGEPVQPIGNVLGGKLVDIRDLQNDLVVADRGSGGFERLAQVLVKGAVALQEQDPDPDLRPGRSQALLDRADPVEPDRFGRIQHHADRVLAQRVELRVELQAGDAVPQVHQARPGVGRDRPARRLLPPQHEQAGGLLHGPVAAALRVEGLAPSVPDPVEAPLPPREHRADERRHLDRLLSSDKPLALSADDESEEKITLPEGFKPLLKQILGEMARGRDVTVLASDAEMTTQEAADYLKVSRWYLVRIIDRGEVPMIGTPARSRSS